MDNLDEMLGLVTTHDDQRHNNHNKIAISQMIDNRMHIISTHSSFPGCSIFPYLKHITSQSIDSFDLHCFPRTILTPLLLAESRVASATFRGLLERKAPEAGPKK